MCIFKPILILYLCVDNELFLKKISFFFQNFNSLWSTIIQSSLKKNISKKSLKPQAYDDIHASDEFM